MCAGGSYATYVAHIIILLHMIRQVVLKGGAYKFRMRMADYSKSTVLLVLVDMLQKIQSIIGGFLSCLCSINVANQDFYLFTPYNGRLSKLCAVN